MTKKTLKDILGEGYLDDMQTSDTVDFVKKHTIDNEPVKKDKKVGTDSDEVFKASNVKKVSRKPHHGHEPDESKGVYEASDPMGGDVTSPTSMNISAPSYAVPVPKKKPDDLKTNAAKPIPSSVGSSTVTKTGPQSSTATKIVGEEYEQIDELKRSTVNSYKYKSSMQIRKNNAKAEAGYPLSAEDEKRDDKRSKGLRMADAKTDGYARVRATEEVSIAEKTLTPAEMKKRKEIADAIKREHPEYSDEKKMRIATAQAIKVAEEKEEKEENDDSWYTHNQIHGNKGISREDWKNGWRMNSKGERVKMKSEETSMDSYLSAISKTDPKRPFNEASTEFGKQFAAAADAYRKGEGSDVVKIGGRDIAIKYKDPESQKKLEADRAAAIKAKSDTAKSEPPKAEAPKAEAPKPAAPQTSAEKKGNDLVASAKSKQYVDRPIGGSVPGITAQTKAQSSAALTGAVAGDNAPVTQFGPRANKTQPASTTSTSKDTSRVPSSDDSSSEQKPSTSFFKLQNIARVKGLNQSLSKALRTRLTPEFQKYINKNLPHLTKGDGGVVYRGKTIPSSSANESVDEAVWDKPSPNKTPEKLTPAEKAKAKARAKAAGRPYPNLVDNMAVAKESVEEQQMDNELSEALKTASSRMNHYHSEIGKLLKGIATGLHQMKKTADQHKSWNGEKGPNWGHVGSMSDYHKQLSDLHDRIHQQGEYMTPAVMKEDINSEYDALKKHSIKELHGMIKSTNPVHDVSEYKTKDYAISKILRDKHGDKKVDAAMKEDYDPEDAEMARTFKNQAKGNLNFVANSGDSSRRTKKRRMRDAVQEYGLSQKYAKKAVTGMDEEVEQIDELDIETYKSYNKASKASGEEILDKLSKGGFKKQMFKKYLNRKGGQERAVRLAGKKVLGEEQVDEAAIKFHYEGPKGAAHIKKDPDTGEHVVRFWKKTDNGLKRHEPADYFTDDKEDAHSTAKMMVGKSVNESSLTSEAIITLVKSIKDKKSKMSDEAMAKKNQ